METITIKTESLDKEDDQQEIPMCTEDRYYSFNDGKCFQCGICGHCTTSKVLLNVHMKMHLVKRQHHCSICKQTFNFISELNNHMLEHTENFSQSVLKENKPEGNNKTEKINRVTVSKQIINSSPLTPLCEKEKYLLIQYIKQLGLNVKYKEMENTKIFLRNGWAKIVELFAENNFERNPDKLARTYFHMKKQAKMHLERFYINKQLPKPRKIDYLFIELCPSEFEEMGLQLHKIQEDGKIYEDDEKSGEDTNSLKQDITTRELNEKHINNIELLPNESISDTDRTALSKPSTSKRIYPEEDVEKLPSKIPKIECEDEDEFVISLKLKFLKAEEKRKEKLYELEMKKIQLEIKFREEIHKKELELKNLEIMLITRKLEENNK